MQSILASPLKRFNPGITALALTVSLSACGDPEPTKGPYDTDPLTPEQAIEAFQVEPGFRLEVVAAEPEITDPVDIAFDENGNLWVAEMLGYPFNPAEGEEPRSRIRFLQDQDGDGRYETATVFADNLHHVSTVQPWKGGILSAAAPDIFFLKDTDGDHKADVKEVWFTGFETDVSPEARVNSLRFGVDNWIYAANAGRAGTITSPKYPDKPGVVVRGHDFRFHPTSGDWEPAAGSVQYGMSFDEWGNRFGSRNTVFLSHAVMPAKYVLRNRFFSPGSAMQFLVEHDDTQNVIYPLTQPQQWRIERTQARQKRYEETNPGRVEHLWGRFSAASGATVYVGDSFPPDYVGNVFVGEVNGNLVRRNILTQDGATFRAHRAPEGERSFSPSRIPGSRPRTSSMRRTATCTWSISIASTSRSRCRSPQRCKRSYRWISIAARTWGGFTASSPRTVARAEVSNRVWVRLRRLIWSPRLSTRMAGIGGPPNGC